MRVKPKAKRKREWKAWALIIGQGADAELITAGSLRACQNEQITTAEGRNKERVVRVIVREK